MECCEFIELFEMALQIGAAQAAWAAAPSPV